MGSKPFSLSGDDIWKAVRGLVYTLAGVVATELLSWAGTIPQTDTTGLAVVIVVSGAANLLKRWVADSTK